MKRITILTGAGFAQAMCKDISTHELTEKIKALNLQECNFKNGGEDRPGEFLYQQLCNETDCSVNFETIIHALEELYSYYTSQNPAQNGETRKENDRVFQGVKPKLFDVNKQLHCKIEKWRKLNLKDDKNKGKHKAIKKIYKNFIQLIINNIKGFNDNDRSKGMKDFDEFLHKCFNGTKNYIIRVYTLNYDNWLYKHSKLKFNDGFGSNNGVFESFSVLESNKNTHCHYNLHGCINWKPQSKHATHNFRRLRNAFNYNSETDKSSDYSNSGEPLLKSPIITGYNKEVRQNRSPFSEFAYSFQRDVIYSDVILIIGYSFSDLHINNKLRVGFKLNDNKKIIIVNKMGELEDGKPNEQEYKRFKSYIEYAFGKKALPEYNSLTVKKNPLSLKSEKIIIWWKGIGEEFYRKWNEMN